MPLYKYEQLFSKLDDAEFDKLYPPAAYTPWPGICRCQGCGKEADSTHTHPLRPQNQHQHTAAQLANDPNDGSASGGDARIADAAIFFKGACGVPSLVGGGDLAFAGDAGLFLQRCFCHSLL